MPAIGANAMANACPFYDTAEPLCCNSDTAVIMQTNFAQLDGVFKTDSSICSANLKRMWCEYACNPNKGSFLVQKGESPAPVGQPGPANLINVQASINDAYACTIYTSCK